jgi:hypothetical protein
MVRLLKKYTFSEADVALPEVQAFYCGDEPWDREVTEWIKSATGDNSVLEDMKQFGTEVWLHRDENGMLVGYSSLGETKYTWPVGSKKKEVVNVLPCIGSRSSSRASPKTPTKTTNTLTRSSMRSWPVRPRRYWPASGIPSSSCPWMIGTSVRSSSTGTEISWT